jgi:hypothetical protein
LKQQGSSEKEAPRQLVLTRSKEPSSHKLPNANLAAGVPMPAATRCVAF